MTAATGTAPAEVAAWMDAAVAGDRAAYGRLYEHYHPVVLRFVNFRVGNPRTAEDLTAETFLRALKRIGTFTWQGRDPGAWFITIARNLVADHFKSGRYRLEVAVDPASVNGGHNPGFTSLLSDRLIIDHDVAVQPEAATLAYLDSAEVLTALGDLTDEQRQCLVLRFLHGLSVAETARAMGKHEGAVKALTYRAARSAAQIMRHPERRRPAAPPPAPPAPPPAPPTPTPAPVIPQPREPVDDQLPADDPVKRRILWRCRDCAGSYAQPFRSHGAPRRCRGWLEPIEVTR